MLRTARANIPPEKRLVAAQAAALLFVESELFKNSQYIACYCAQGSELALDPLMQLIWQKRKKCYLPALSSTQENTLDFLLFSKGDALQSNRHGILEPEFSAENEIAPSDLDIVLVPLLGFDNQGYRLGSGSGYYDKTFEFLFKKSQHAKPLFIGVGYELQRVDSLPHDKWDVRLDAVLTEARLFCWGQS